MIIDDVATPQTGYYILSSPTDTPYTSKSVPALFITSTLYNEWQYITQKRQEEIAAFWVTKEIADGGPHYLAYELVIPKQNVTPVLASIDGEAIKDVTTSLKPQFPNNGMHKHLTHAHLHPNMGVGWSGTDITQQNTKGELGFESEYRIYVVSNSNMKLHASYVTYSPVFHRIEEMTIGICVKDAPTALTKERKAELDQLVADNVITQRPKAVESYFNWRDVTADTLAPGTNNLQNWRRGTELDLGLDVLNSSAGEACTANIEVTAYDNLMETLTDIRSAAITSKIIQGIVQNNPLASKLTTLYVNFPSMFDAEEGIAHMIMCALKEGVFDDGPIDTLEEFIEEVSAYV